MQLFLTSVLPFLAHDHASAVAFLTCRHHNLHSSIIPEFLSDEARVGSFCNARQQDELEAVGLTRHSHLFKLFVQTPLMQFSPSLLLIDEDCTETIIKPLLETKYFTRSLQRCLVPSGVTHDLLQGLSKVRSLIKLDFGRKTPVKNEHLESIVNSFPSIDMLNIQNAGHLEVVDPKTALSIASPPPPATSSLREMRMSRVNAVFATRCVCNFTNLRKLELCANNSSRELDLRLLTSSLPLLADLYLERCNLRHIESLKNLVHLSTLRFFWCKGLELSFLSQQNNLPELTTLSLEACDGLASNSFASLTYAPNLRLLKLNCLKFNNDSLRYLENMVHLRRLDLSESKITGDSRSLKSLMQNLFQLEELDLSCCRIGNQAAITGALYSTHSRMRVLNLRVCSLVDDDLNGIGALKNTLEVLDLSYNNELTNEALKHCNGLVKLNKLRLHCCFDINDLSPLKDCLNLQQLDVSECRCLTDNSFKVFSEEPNSFPNLRVLALKDCSKFTGKVFEHLAKNNHLVYQLTELNIAGMAKILSSSATARKNICQLKGLRILRVTRLGAPDASKNVKLELLRELKNLQGF